MQDKLANTLSTKRNEKLVNTVLFKERNGLNTDKETAEMLSVLFDKVKDMEFTSKDPLPDISPIPLAACRQIYPYYKETLQVFLTAYEEFKNAPDDANLRNEMYDTFAKFYEMASFLGDKMYLYAEYCEEYIYEDIPEEPFITLAELCDNPFMVNMEKAVSLVKKTDALLQEDFDDADKTKFMTLASLLTGSAYDIFSTIREEKSLH